MRPQKYYYILTILIFFLSIIWGLLIANIFPQIINPLLQALNDKFESVINASPFVLFLYIFFNNSFIDLLMIILFFLFGLIPVYFLASNGFVIGIVINESLKKTSLLGIIAVLLPHGILEIPAFIIASSYGLWLGVKLLRKMVFREPFKPYFVKALGIFFKVILPLNFLAALIEVYITPFIYSLTK